jgi:hypothetical protein
MTLTFHKPSQPSIFVCLTIGSPPLHVAEDQTSCHPDYTICEWKPKDKTSRVIEVPTAMLRPLTDIDDPAWKNYGTAADDLLLMEEFCVHWPDVLYCADEDPDLFPMPDWKTPAGLLELVRAVKIRDLEDWISAETDE